jgi:hypothetical protein
MSAAEKFLGPKHLASEIKEHTGIVVSERFVRSVVVESGIPRLGFNVRYSELVTWWLANPDFAPRAKNPAKRSRASLRVRVRHKVATKR